jgi:DHA2 family multidrug resistance protein-like MFS transporter
VSDVWLMLAMMLAGIGFGFFQTPNNRVMIGSAPRNRAGAVGGLQATTRVLGQTFGGAVVASLFALGLDAGPTLGLIAAILFALVAVAVNVIRHRQTSSAQEG